MKDEDIEEIEDTQDEEAIEELFEDSESQDDDSFIEAPILKTNSSSTSDIIKSQLEKNKNKQINDTKASAEKNKTGYNGFKNPKSFINNDKKTASRLASVRGGRLSLPFNRNNVDENSQEVQQGEEKEDLVKKSSSGASNIIKSRLGGTTGGKTNSAQAELSKQAAKKYILKLLKSKLLLYIICGLVILTVFIVFLTLLVSSEDDESETRKETDSYILGTGTEDDLISYLIQMNYCDDFKTCKDTNAFKFYKNFKEQYEKYQGSCPPKMGESYLKNGGTPCEVTVNVPVIFETLSFNLTDFELFGSLSFGGKKSDNVDLKNVLKTTSKDIKKLSLAMSEYVHEKCYELKTVEQCSSTSSGGNTQSSSSPSNTNQGLPSAGAGTVLSNSSSSSTSGKVCKTVQVKEKKDKYYFQISFDKYVSYLKYGDTSSHPNLSKKEPLLVGDYDNRMCTGPQDDTIAFGPNKSENSTNSGDSNNPSITGSGKGSDIANYALQFVGNPYVYGGNSLTNGTDCSGFVKLVLEHFGISVPRTSDEQRTAGTDVGKNISDAQPGDIICYNGHVAIYLGGNRIVHASNPKDGIKISNNAQYRTILSIRRFV